MGKVEDIYRAIRNNKIVAIHYVRPSDEELTEGVARIRQRLTAVGQPQTKKIEVRNRLLAPKFWIPAAALAAAAVLLVVLQLPRPHTEEHLLRHAGQPLRLNTAYQIRQDVYKRQPAPVFEAPITISPPRSKNSPIGNSTPDRTQRAPAS